jgi:glycosyltransferase involved in cell wall biosynthesis
VARGRFGPSRFGTEPQTFGAGRLRAGLGEDSSVATAAAIRHEPRIAPVSPELSVVMPVYNEAPDLAATIDALVAAVQESRFDAELVLVDDGSTDGSTEALRSALGRRLPLSVVSQPNRGRFLAVREGLRRARGPYVLVLGSRVRLRPGALAFVRDRRDAGERVWAGHVHIHTGGNPYGLFQNVLTEIAWREYFDRPRTVSFGAESFDHYPKGSGCLFAPRHALVEAFAEQPTRYADPRHANDDTPMLRQVVATERIHVSPSFAADYLPRATFRTFVKHSLHRGTVFLDGHGRRDSRFFPFVLGFFPVSVALAAAALLRPRIVPVSVAGVVVAAGTVAASAGRSRREIATVAGLSPVWAVAFGAGLWRGLAMLAAVRLRSRAPGRS